MDEMERWCAAASVIISHSGAVSILTAQRFDKPLLLVPRLRIFEEVIDNHQLELALALEATGQAVAVQDVAQLASALKLARQCRWDTNRRKAQLVAELRAVAIQRASWRTSHSTAAKPR
jgi:UDP-N-acetylglucosamine transferase subunit ALG13